MKSHFQFVACSLGLWFTLACPAAEFKFANQTLTVPEGFEIELIAGPPLINRPIEADLDEQGHLYVSDSSGSNERGPKQLEEKSHRILRLEDSTGSGRFDKATVFADKMMFPEGILWYEGAVYCGAAPTIWKLEDADGDGVAEKRTEWFKGETLTGCANDVHGPYLGPDGFIYWCKGAFAKQTHERPGRKPISDSAAHVFRCRPDGSEFDSVMGGGMDNPVGIAFNGVGDAFFTTTFFTNPQGGKRDALVHAIYGGVYPKVNGVTDELKHTGDLMPAMTHLGPAAPCGITCYASRIFGADYEGNLFSCQFNLHKVQRHILEPMGATFKTRDIDFVTSDSTDFHPTDVMEDADGSLIVIDTGGWYKICCPTSQIAKPDVLGAIYRVRRKGAPKVEDARGAKISWSSLKPADLVKLLDDARPVVRNRAIAQLGKAGKAAVRPLADTVKKSASSVARLNAVWALTRINEPAAREAVRVALKDLDPTVQQAAVHSVGLYRDDKASARLQEILKSGSPQLQRSAATSLGQMESKPAVPALLTVAGSAQDRILEHALIYALIQIGDREGTAAGLKSASVLTHRAALIALDQMDDGRLPVTEVAPLLAAKDPVLKDTASWVASHHPDWGKDLSGFFQTRLAARNTTDADRAELQSQLADFARDATIQEFMVTTLTNAATPAVTRQLVLQAMAKASLNEMPVVWSNVLPQALADADEPVVCAAVAVIRAVPLPKKSTVNFTEPLARVGHEEKRSAEARLEALTALPSGLSPVEPALFDFLRANLNAAKPPLIRTMAAGIISRAKLSEEQLIALTESLKIAGPLELSKLLAAFEKSSSEAVGLKFVAALKQAKGVKALRADAVKPRLAKYPASVQQQAEELLSLLNVDAGKQKAHLDEVMASLTGGDVRRGQAVFNSPRAVCSTCHAIGYLGGHVGPDLTRVGQIRTERDLLEAIVYPSASFVRSFEPMIISTKDGEEYSGIIKNENNESVLLVSGPNAEQLLARANIAEIRPGTLSIMPEGLDQQLSRQELADLIAFLRSLK